MTTSSFNDEHRLPASILSVDWNDWITFLHAQDAPAKLAALQRMLKPLVPDEITLFCRSDSVWTCCWAGADRKSWPDEITPDNAWNTLSDLTLLPGGKTIWLKLSQTPPTLLKLCRT